MSAHEQMIRVVSAAGSFAVGNSSLGEAAQEWEDAEFTPEEADYWLSHGRCFDPASARVLADLGVTPKQAGAEYGSDTIGYAVANGDLSAKKAVALVQS